jgi:hypothetical protein
MNPPINEDLAREAMCELVRAFRNHTSKTADEVKTSLRRTVRNEYQHMIDEVVDEIYGGSE